MELHVDYLWNVLPIVGTGMLGVFLVTGVIIAGGSLLNAGAFALLLILLCFGGWGEGIAVRGLILLALILLGGLLAALLCGKVGKRSNKRLVKSHKKLRSV